MNKSPYTARPACGICCELQQPLLDFDGVCTYKLVKWLGGLAGAPSLKGLAVSEQVLFQTNMRRAWGRMNPYLSVVIPAHNESAILPVTFECLREFLEQQGFLAEVIVVDDGSTDNTPAVIREWTRSFECLRVLRNSVKAGKGASIRRGILVSRGEYVFVCDADLPGRPEDILRLLDRLREGAAVAVASRRATPFRAAPSASRFFASVVYRALVRAILNLPLRDTQCGFKAFVREPLLPVAQELVQRGFSFDAEFLFAAWKRGLAIKEIDFEVVERRPTRHAILLQSPRMFFDLLSIRLMTGRRPQAAIVPSVELEPAPLEVEAAANPLDNPR